MREFISRLDLTGRVFGKWTCMEKRLVKNQNKGFRAEWKCRCECGTEKWVYYVSLHAGASKSCGCATHEIARASFLEKRDDIEPKKKAYECVEIQGARFGKLQVIKKSGSSRDPNGSYRWECECDCKKMVSVTGKSLLNGHIKSCEDCRVVGKKGRKRKDNHKISRDYWNSVRNGAIRRRLGLFIDRDEALEIFDRQNGLCAISGMKIDLCYNPTMQTASIDRIDSEGDYTRSNTQWLHRDINRMKLNLPEDYFISLCEKIVAHHYDLDVANSVILERCAA